MYLHFPRHVRLTKTYSLKAQKVVAKEVIDAYNAWDVDRIIAYRTSDCKQQVLPATLNRTAKSNDEYRAFFKSIEPLYKNFTVRLITPPKTRLDG
jgi:hypothetical protein